MTAHDALAADLAAHLEASKAVTAWADMQLGPSGSPRPIIVTAASRNDRLR